MINGVLEPIDSRSKLIEQLRLCAQSILLGNDQESLNECFLCMVGACTVGLCYQGHGIKPSVLIDESRQRAWVIYDCRVALVDLFCCETRFEVTFAAPVFEIASELEDSSVIVVYEVGACRLAGSGEILWEHGAEVVVRTEDGDRSLRLYTADAIVELEKTTGAILCISNQIAKPEQ